MPVKNIRKIAELVTTNRNSPSDIELGCIDDVVIYVARGNYQNCYTLITKTICMNKTVSQRFSLKKIIEFVLKKILEVKEKDIQIEKNSFFNELLAIESHRVFVRAPISGIKLQKEDVEFSHSIFKFGYFDESSGSDMPLSREERGMYIQVELNEVYDDQCAIKMAEEIYDNFIKLIFFLAGRIDNKINIKVGLPSYPDAGPDSIYVSSSSYELMYEEGEFHSMSISNTICDKISINDDFFIENQDFPRIWDLFTRKHDTSKKKLNDMESRIIDTALYIGDTFRTPNTDYSIIFVAAALERLFSYSDGALFQKSIGEKLADIFVYLAGHDLASRDIQAKLLKEVYGYRSAIMHGGKATDLLNKHMHLSILLSGVISKLLKEEEFNTIKEFSDLYKKVKDAQYSYSSVIDK